MIDQPFRQLVESLAARTPTPGGGAAAALAASMGTALVLMVVRFSRGKKANAAREDDLQRTEQFLADLVQRTLPMAERDCASFDHVSAAYALPKDTDQQKEIRTKAVEEAMGGAMVVPEELLCLVRDVLNETATIAGCIGKAIVSDLGSGVEMLFAAAQAALLNVRINAQYLQDRARADAASGRALSVFAEIERQRATLRGGVDGALA